MSWQPSKLTREQMEERRRRGAELLRANKMTKAEIARELGVSRAAVGKWSQMLQEKGVRGLAQRYALGNASKLTADQKKELKEIVKAGAKRSGFPTERWTLKRLKRLIQQRFGAVYHVSSVSRLMHSLNLTPQQPISRATERDEPLIRAWLSKDWVRIKKSAAKTAKHHLS